VSETGESDRTGGIGTGDGHVSVGSPRDTLTEVRDRGSLAEALYYPRIEFRNTAWVKAAALFYNRIYRIVPRDVHPYDQDEIRPLLEDGTVGSPLDPARYAERAADEFLAKAKDTWSAAAIEGGTGEATTLAQLHEGKIDERLRKLYEELGFKLVNGYFNLPRELAHNYMLYLAQVIANENRLDLVTEEDSAWVASSYFASDGDFDDSPAWLAGEADSPGRFYLFCMLLEEIVPANISAIPVFRIIEFRKEFGPQMREFRASLEDLEEALHASHDPKVWKDRFMEAVQGYKMAIEQYKRASRILKVDGWLGFLGFTETAPAFAAQLLGAGSLSQMILLGAGLAIGAVWSLRSTQRSLRALRSKNPVVGLMDLESDAMDANDRVQGRGRLNLHLTNMMEEYIND
jgi:hypothetical protein